MSFVKSIYGFKSLVIGLVIAISPVAVAAANAQQVVFDEKVLLSQSKDFQEALQLTQQEKYSAALNIWQEMLKSEMLIPQLKRAIQNNIGAVLLKQEKYSEAKLYIENALKADAQVLTTMNNLNQLYAYEAQKAYQRVFKKTNVKLPKAELLYFDVKHAEIPNDLVITDVNNADYIKVVKNATEQWRQAWSSQDIKGYLSFYDDKEFLPKSGVSVQAWKKSRYPSLLRPKFIKINTDNLQIAPISSDLVRVNFYQRYESDRFKDSINKVLLWKKIDGQWKIIQEAVVYSNA